MNKLLKILLASSAICAFAYNAIAGEEIKTAIDKTPSSSSEALTNSSVVAEYNNTKVKVEDIIEQFGPMLDQQPELKGKKFTDLDKNIQESLIRGYIHNKIVTLEVESQKTMESPEFTKRLPEMKTQLAHQIIIETLLKQKIKESDLKAEYEKFKKDTQGQQEFKTSHIVVSDEAKAKEVKAKLDKGGKFEDLAKEYSIDPGSKENGGDIGFASKGQLDQQYESKVATMKKGQVSDPVKSQFGWHIIKLVDTRSIQPPSFEEIKMQINNKLAKDVITNYMKELDSKYKVKITY